LTAVLTASHVNMYLSLIELYLPKGRETKKSLFRMKTKNSHDWRANFTLDA